MWSKWFKLLILVALLSQVFGHTPCALRRYPSGYVCVCNSTYCDTLDDDLVTLSDPNQVKVITSSARGLRFHRTEGSWSNQEPVVVEDHVEDSDTRYVPWHKKLLFFLGNLPHLFSNKAEITVNEGLTFQKIKGFGGALTGSVIYNLDGLSESLQEKLVSSYYSNEVGIAYNMVRVSIGGSDFDLAPWAYNELPLYDGQLTNFSQLDPRDMSIVRRINKIKTFFRDQEDRSLKIKAAAWGCPRWMRTPSRRINGPGLLKPKFYQTWANYHIRYLQLMKEQGIDIWALSMGNEPMNGLISWILAFWMNVGWHAKDAAKYVAENLGPTLRQSEFNNTLILAGDDQRFFLPWYFTNMQKAYPEAFDYIDGLAIHSYFDPDTSPELLDLGQELFPDQFILYTESSVGTIRYNPQGPLLGSWERAAEYVEMYREALLHSVVGWIDWNLILDETGGPNYVGNVVDSAVIANATGQEAYKQPIFYAIGHYSKFVSEGSVRIEVCSDWKEVGTIGFKRTDGSIAVIIHNRYIDGVEVTLRGSRGTKTFYLPAESVSTVVYAGEASQ